MLLPAGFGVSSFRCCFRVSGSVSRRCQQTGSAATAGLRVGIAKWITTGPSPRVPHPPPSREGFLVSAMGHHIGLSLQTSFRACNPAVRAVVVWRRPQAWVIVGLLWCCTIGNQRGLTSRFMVLSRSASPSCRPMSLSRACCGGRGTMRFVSPSMSPVLGVSDRPVRHPDRGVTGFGGPVVVR